MAIYVDSRDPSAFQRIKGCLSFSPKLTSAATAESVSFTLVDFAVICQGQAVSCLVATRIGAFPVCEWIGEDGKVKRSESWIKFYCAAELERIFPPQSRIPIDAIYDAMDAALAASGWCEKIVSGAAQFSATEACA